MVGGKAMSETGGTAAGAARNRAGDDGRMVVGAGGRRRRRAGCRGVAGSVAKARGAAAVCAGAEPPPPLRPRRRRGAAAATSVADWSALTKSRGGDDGSGGRKPCARCGNGRLVGRRLRGWKGRAAGGTNIVVMAPRNTGATWNLLQVNRGGNGGEEYAWDRGERVATRRGKRPRRVGKGDDDRRTARCSSWSAPRR